MPTMFIYGTQKRCMFHTPAFEAKMKVTDGNVVRAYDCAHWIMFQKPKELNSDLRAFLID
jgi:pimeloyl-ACP methyl ester carboxylesterase